jgi:NADH-quinone oxidoreductase subunit M
MHTREIARYGGLVARMPAYAAVFMVFMLASVGLPGTSGFVGEFLVLMGAFQSNTWAGFLATIGLIVGVPYMLYLYRRIIFGEMIRAELRTILDLNKRELATFAPLVALVLWMGVYPKPFLDVFASSVDMVVTRYQSALSHPPQPAKPAERMLATAGAAQ